MKTFKATALLCLLIVVSFIACEKDIISPEESITQNHFQIYNWSEQERNFFSLTERIPQKARGRTAKKTIFHPLVINAYNEIARQNEQHHFVDTLALNFGYPLWRKAYVYEDDSSGNNLVMLPFIPPCKRYAV